MLKKITLFVAVCVLSWPVYAQDGGETDGEKQNPFSFEGSYIGDFYGNTRGGLKTGGGFMGMANIKIGFDTGAARWWKGGSFFINGASIHGKSLSEHYLGDLQIASNIDAGEHVYMHELWFRQEFSLGREGSRFYFKAGLQDLNAEFVASEGAGEFINSSFGIPSVMALNVPVPIFPLTGLGVELHWDINARYALHAAVFDGDQAPFENNPYNLKWSINRRDGILGMLEADGKFTIGGKAGTYKAGGYYYSADKNWGIYALADQTVVEGDRHSLGLFAQAAVAPKGKNANDYYVGLGANLSGVFSRHRRDALGIAVAHAGLHGTADRHETAVELYYKYTFNDNIALQPDVQYIINPAGTAAKLPNALACILRLHVNF